MTTYPHVPTPAELEAARAKVKYAQEVYTCAATGKIVRMPHGSTASPYCLMECSPGDATYPECRSCDLVHHYETILPEQPKRRRKNV